jgi:hypothetical protein
MLQKPLTNLGCLRANKHAKTLIQAVSGRFSGSTNLNIILAGYLMMPVGKRYYGDVQWPSVFAAGMGLVRRQASIH